MCWKESDRVSERREFVELGLYVWVNVMEFHVTASTSAFSNESFGGGMKTDELERGKIAVEGDLFGGNKFGVGRVHVGLVDWAVDIMVWLFVDCWNNICTWRYGLSVYGCSYSVSVRPYKPNSTIILIQSNTTILYSQ